MPDPTKPVESAAKAARGLKPNIKGLPRWAYVGAAVVGVVVAAYFFMRTKGDDTTAEVYTDEGDLVPYGASQSGVTPSATSGYYPEYTNEPEDNGISLSDFETIVGLIQTLQPQPIGDVGGGVGGSPGPVGDPIQTVNHTPASAVATAPVPVASRPQAAPTKRVTKTCHKSYNGASNNCRTVTITHYSDGSKKESNDHIVHKGKCHNPGTNC